MRTDKKIYCEGKWRKCHIADGYYRFNLNGKIQLLHRFLYQKYYRCSILPHIDVHHKDGNKLNNDINNLELLTRAEHIREHKFKGGSVSWYKPLSKWRVQVWENKKRKYLGLFLTEQEARKACDEYYKGKEVALQE